MASATIMPARDDIPRSPHSVDPMQEDVDKPRPYQASRRSSDASPGDPMDVTPPTTATMGPPSQSSPEVEQGTSVTLALPQGESRPLSNGHVLGPQGAGAAAAASIQQPKVVQTAFIHKLYNMLEDPNIQHLISWSSSNEGFVMSPSNEFSKVLAQYFKHTNISSFVRQLNMYGFHKVSDVFHTGSPESPLWEFKHGNGNFKRGDLIGLREIKRRTSRHALIHRDSFSSGPKSSSLAPGTPAEPVIPESAESRLSSLESTVYEMHGRLLRSDETNIILATRNQAIVDNLSRCHRWTHDLSHFILAAFPDPDSPIHRDILSLQKDISHQSEQLRSLREPPEAILENRHPYFSGLTIDSAPLSPRQAPLDDPRRPLPPHRQNMFRQPNIPNHLNVGARRYGSVGTAGQAPAFRPVPPQQPAPAPPQQHPLASVTEPTPNIPRRHTSADIREHGWQPPGASPFAPTGASPQPPPSKWPPAPASPSRGPMAPVDPSAQQVRDVLASYQIGASSRSFGSRHATPPLTSDNTPSAASADSGWSFGAMPRFTAAKAADLPSGPQTRRSSMASNVHSLLNPAETMERDEEDGGDSERKRKRI
ncbi:MAG: hypothetical protein M1814_000288 [Vezdaea aestivalis]|nr:MAG: hypothetical protein M1814_000288 [Vezdaea aestivalis]